MSKTHHLAILRKLLKTDSDIDYLSKLEDSEIEELIDLTRKRVDFPGRVSRPGYRIPSAYFAKGEKQGQTDPNPERPSG